MTIHEITAPAATFNFAEHLLRLNAGRPEKVAFIDDAREMTFGELDSAVKKMASALLYAGIRREERVLLLMHDCNYWPVAFLGALYAGVVPVAVNTLLTADDYAYMLMHSRSRAVLASSALTDVLSEALSKVDHDITHVVVSGGAGSIDGQIDLHEFISSQRPAAECASTSADDAAFWLYSSGSTGRPKGTVHTHANPYWTAELYGKGVLGLRESDVCFSAAKLFFAYGLGNALSFPMSVGATTVLMAGRPTPTAVFDKWKAQRPTIFFGAPTGYAAMLADPQKPSPDQIALRLASSAGEALPSELGEQFTRHYGVEIIDGIGSTEMLHIYLSNVPGSVHYGTTGYPVPGYEIRLVGDDGNAVADGEPGDLYVKGPSAALMYWNNREKSRDTFQGEWTKSGDKYVRNPEGTYTYSGRTDDMLKVSGMYVSPFEVEASLVKHEAVLEAAVIGKEDDSGLTKTKAFVVLKPEKVATEAELQAFVKDQLAPYKYPRAIEFIDALPKTATGKIQRFRLRQREKGVE
jgi:benzoate-CoA ligase